MPVIKSAKKKLKQDKKRTLARAKVETLLKDAIKKATASASDKTVRAATSLIDKAAKKHIIHKNKAARIKSRLAHLVSKPAVKVVKKESKDSSSPRSKTVKKSPAKKK